MSGKRNRAAALALAVSAVVAGNALGQDQTRNSVNWVNINGTAVQPVATPTPGVTVFSTGPTAGGGSSSAAPLFGTAVLIDGAAAQRVGDVLLDNRQPVTLAGLNAADMLNIYVTAGLRGTVTLNAGGTARAEVRAELYRDVGAGVFNPVPGVFVDLVQNGAGANNQFGIGRTTALGGTFRFDVLNRLSGTTAANTGGMGNTLDFALVQNANTVNHEQRGSFVTLIASPTNLPNSRDAIGVARARGELRLMVPDGAGMGGAIGRGVRLGQIEPYRPATTHTALPVAALTIDPASANDYYRDEHSLAVAGIMIGRSNLSDRAGVSPGATLASVATRAQGLPTRVENGLSSLAFLVNGATPASIINISAGADMAVSDGATRLAEAYDWLAVHRKTLVVTAAGNDGRSAGAPGAGQAAYRDPMIIPQPMSISGDNGGFNTLTVGALDFNFNARSFTSSFGPTRDPAGRTKPEIVAPGRYILSAVAADANLDGNENNDFERVFFGRYTLSNPEPDGGAQISGTSFAAPHVAGALGMMTEFSRFRDGQLPTPAERTKGARTDPRILKVAVMNTAARNIFRFGGAPPAAGMPRAEVPWGQNAPNAMNTITQPLDPELGAGMIQVDQAMLQVFGREVSSGDAVGPPARIQHFDAPTTGWDLQDLNASTVVNSRVVDYKFDRALVRGQTLRATSTWYRGVDKVGGNGAALAPADTFTVAAMVSNLNMSVWEDVPMAERMPAGPMWVRKLTSDSANDNVELIHDYRVGKNAIHWLELRNLNGGVTRAGTVWRVSGNPAGAAGLGAAALVAPPEETVAVATVSDPLPVEEAMGRVVKATFDGNALLSGSDRLFVMDDNFDFVYATNASYPIYFGSEFRSNPLDVTSDVDWFAGPTISLNSLVTSQGWRQLPSMPADAEGNLPASLIGDGTFLSELATRPFEAIAQEYNFVIDVNLDGLFTQEIDGIGWFQVVPEPGVGMIGLAAILLTGRRRRVTSPS